MPKIYKPQNELGNILVDITKIGYNNGNQFNEDFINIETEIKSEGEARTEADSILQDNIDAENTRATQAESLLQANIDIEKNARITTDTDLQRQLNIEINRSKDEDRTIKEDLQNEITRATAAETALSERTNELENTTIKTVTGDNFIIGSDTINNTVSLTLNTSIGNTDSVVTAADGDADGSKTVSTVKDINAAIAAEKTRAESIESGFNTRITTLESDNPKIISVTGQTITNPENITEGSNIIISTDSDIDIKTVLSVITKDISIGWTVNNTNTTTTISITKDNVEIASLDPSFNISGKWIKSGDSVYISVFKRALGEEGNNWITVNDAGEAVLNFPDETNPLIENIKLGYSSFTKVTGTTGGKKECSKMLYYANASNVDITVPKGENCDSMMYDCHNIENIDIALPNCKQAKTIFSYALGLITAKITAPEAINIQQAFANCNSLTDVYISSEKAQVLWQICYEDSALVLAEIIAPNARDLGWAFDGANNLTILTFNFATMNTLDFTQSKQSVGIGNVTTLENVTVLDGGLASCTSFIITNSTNLTDESIQNIIDALPDYSGTETSALVSFPPNRLTEEQQTQLSNKGWTWS